MKYFNNQKIINVIQETFKDIDPKLVEAKKDLDIIIEHEKNFYKDWKSEDTSERIKIMKEFKSNNITATEMKEKMESLNKISESKKDKMQNVNGMLLMEEFKNTHLINYNIKGFEKGLQISSDPIKYKEVCAFNREYDGMNFNIEFFTENNELNLDVTVKENNKVLTMILYKRPEKENLCIGLIDIDYKGILVECKSCDKSKQFFDSITETDLLNLDSEENEEMFSILFDANLNLSSDPLYSTFKKGMKDFGDIIEDLSNNKKNNLKI